MKKTLAVMMSALMVGGLALSGCGGGQTATTAAPTEAAKTEAAGDRVRGRISCTGGRFRGTGDDYNQQLAGGGGGHIGNL